MTNRNGKCVCDEGHFNRSFGLIFCFDRAYYKDKLQSEDYTTMRVQFESGQECLPCPGCVKCDVDAAPVVEPGFSLSPTGTAIWTSSLMTNTSLYNDDGSLAVNDQQRQLDRSLFLCPVEGRACGNASTADTDADGEYQSRRLEAAEESGLIECAPGHGGVLCGTCLAGWTGGFNQLCSKCPQSGGLAGTIAMLICMIISAVICYRWARKAQGNLQARLNAVRLKYAMAKKAVKAAQQIKGETDGMTEMEDGGIFQSTQETIKIVVSNTQIISQFPTTLEFSCATCESFKAMMKVIPMVNIDVLGAVSFDCISPINLYSRFFFIVTSPVILILAVQLRARLLGGTSREQIRVQQEAEGQDSEQMVSKDDTSDEQILQDRVKDANQLSMLIIFVTYPTISSTIFTMFACRDLDMNQSYHVYDTSVDCNSETYKAVRTIALVLLMLMPIGVPLGASLFTCPVQVPA
jgi:hypothetical protein